MLHTPFLALDPLATSSDDALRYPDTTTDASYPSMYQAYADRSESSSRRHSPSTSGRNTPNSFSAPSMTLRNPLFNDKVSLPPIGSMFNPPADDIYEPRRNSLPYPSANRSAIPSGAAQWLPGLGMHGNDDALRPRGSTGSGASTGSPNSPASSSPSFTTGYSSSSTAPTTVKSSPGTSPFSDRLSLPAAPSTAGREWSAPVTIPVPPSDNNTISSGHSASPTPVSDSPPTATSAAPPARRRGKLPKHVTETLRTWLLSHADHPYPTEEEKKMLCNVTSLTLSQVSNWMINARRRILVPASKQQAALNATTGPYLGMARSSAATDLARANRQSMNIPHTLSSHALPHSHPDPYAGAYTLPPHLSPAGDLHLSASRSTYPTLATGGRPSYAYPPPNIQNYYGNGMSSVTAGLASYSAGLVQGSGRYYGDQDHHSYSATH